MYDADVKIFCAVNGDDRDRKQTLSQDLDSDEYSGRHHIRALMGIRARSSQYEDFIETSRSFLLVVTHTAMIDCLSVDTYVGSLYNFISGANGTRAIPFFQHLCQIIATTLEESAKPIRPERLESTMIALVAALSEILRREFRARYNDDLPDLLNSLEIAAQLIDEHGSNPASGLITNRAVEFRALVARASGLLGEEAGTDFDVHPSSLLHSSYPRDVVIPGDHHDNDKADITKISIFPTRAEILSEAQEFLPSTDPDQPHFLSSKLERHIDTHFRLLRHDVFGSLKDTLGSFMKTVMNDPNQLTNANLELGDTRTYTYSKTFVKYLMLDSRKGLQAQVSFPHPHRMRAESVMDRCRRWEESKRLEEGVLLSFVWIQDSHLKHQFFLVDEKNTDTKRDDSLAHNVNTATITIKLPTRDEQAIEALLDLSRQKIRGILIEYPNVLPATFLPVLANLQNMQRLGQLPFCEWVLPESVHGTSGAILDVPPPRYARRAGFVFPLLSILKEGACNMSLHPVSSDNDARRIAELETNTGLDHGQCVALIAALTREYAFIQGQPGTGKSYLGVELMKILLAVKNTALLGPIIVV